MALGIRLLIHLRDQGMNLVRAVKTQMRLVDIERWKQVGRTKPLWDDRNVIIAKLIPPGTSFVDIGCGAQTLRSYADPTCKYQPVDVVKHDESVWVWNFNAEAFPHPEARFDVAVCSGVFEYSTDPHAFLKTVSHLAPRLILSFAGIDDVSSTLDRRASGWTNDMSQAELRSALDALGGSYTVAAQWREQVVYDISFPPHRTNANSQPR